MIKLELISCSRKFLFFWPRRFSCFLFSHPSSHDKFCHLVLRVHATSKLTLKFRCSLEKVCHDHQQMMCVRADQSDDLISGHALMMSMPPPEHVRKYPDSVFPHKAGFDVPANILMKVHISSMHLPIQGGELAPIQALGVVRNHERYRELNEADFAWLTQKLAPSVRCYG